MKLFFYTLVLLITFQPIWKQPKPTYFILNGLKVEFQNFKIKNMELTPQGLENWKKEQRLNQ